VVELLRPKHPAQRLAHDIGAVGGKCVGDDGRVELVGLVLSRSKYLFEVGADATWFLGHDAIGQPQAYDEGLPGADRGVVMSRRLRAAVLGIHRVGHQVHDVVVDAVLRKRGIIDAEQTPAVGLVLCEEELGGALEVQRVATGSLVIERDG
jgi:hypothetical protein